jgi:hypothetical protein
MHSDDITKFTESLTKEANEIRKDALELTWSMRGGIQYESLLKLSFKERKMINEISKSNLEIAKKSGMPYF